MDPLKNTDEKINKYCTLIFYIFLTILACIGAFYAIFAAYDWKIEKNDFTNWLITVGTIASAFGLICFSGLTYKNQKNNEFHSLFKVLLEENNKLLKEIIEFENNNSKISNKYYDLLILNKHIIDLFKNNFLKDECNLRNEAQFEINFNEEVVKEIDLHHKLKPYLITLFRLLKIISTSSKISYHDKTDLLIESEFFEHLPITESWLTDVYYLFGQKFAEKDEAPFLSSEEIKKIVYPLEKYILSGKVINLEAFGQSIYLKKHLFKASKL